MTTHTNTATQHTPGPWVASTFPQIVGGNRTVASVHGDVTASHGEMRANARLIAAAPDMLEALRVVASLPGFERDEPYSALVAAAIAKATGGAG